MNRDVMGILLYTLSTEELKAGESLEFRIQDHSVHHSKASPLKEKKSERYISFSWGVGVVLYAETKLVSNDIIYIKD